MVWKVPQFDVPIPTPGQVNPFNQALSSGLDTYQNMVKARYAVPTMEAANAAKNAYAQNVGRQSLATVLNNPTAVALMGREKFQQMLDQVNKGPAFDNQSQPGKSQPSFLEKLAHLVGLGDTSAPTQPQAPNTQSGNPATPNASGNAEPSGPANPVDTRKGSDSNVNSGMSFDENGDNVRATDAQIDQAANRGTTNNSAQPAQNVPRRTTEIDAMWDAATAKALPLSPSGIKLSKEKGFQEQLGKENAKHLTNIADVYDAGIKKQATYDKVMDLLQSPEFIEMKKVPLSGHYEMDYFAKLGTPEQRKAVGAYRAATGEIIKDASRDFAGQFRVGEQTLLENQKPNDSDTVEVATGKMQTISDLNKFWTLRASLTGQYMLAGKDRLNASELADKQLHGDKVRADAKKETDRLEKLAKGKTPWPEGKEATNEIKLAGQAAPEGSVWMIRPDGIKVPVHKNHVERATNDPKLKYRIVE